MNPRNHVAIVAVSAAMVAVPELVYEVRGSCRPGIYLSISEDAPQPPVVIVTVDPTVDDNDHDAWVITTTSEEPADDVDESALVQVDWVPGVGLVYRG